MDSASNWVTSTIPLAGGASNTQIVSSTETVTFTVSGLETDFTAKSGTNTFVATKLTTSPNLTPQGQQEVFDDQYWIVQEYETGIFTTDLSFAFATGGSWFEAVANDVLTLNQWQHVATVYNGSSIKLYVDGEEVASESKSGSITTSSGNLHKGGTSEFSDRNMVDKIDEVAIWNIPITQSHIQDIIHHSVPISDNGLVA